MIINSLIERETTTLKPMMGATIRERDYHGKYIN